jgi:hypothetical protein
MPDTCTGTRYITFLNTASDESVNPNLRFKRSRLCLLVKTVSGLVININCSSLLHIFYPFIFKSLLDLSFLMAVAWPSAQSLCSCHCRVACDPISSLSLILRRSTQYMVLGPTSYGHILLFILGLGNSYKLFKSAQECDQIV